MHFFIFYFFFKNDFIFLFKFHWSLVLRVQLTINQHWFTSWIAFSPHRCQAIDWTSADLSVGLSGTNLSEIWLKIIWFSLKELHLKYCLQNGSHFVQPSICQTRKRCFMSGNMYRCMCDIVFPQPRPARPCLHWVFAQIDSLYVCPVNARLIWYKGGWSLGVWGY